MCLSLRQKEAKSYNVQMLRGLAAGYVDEDLYWEYRRLFVGPQAKVAPPWGSVYLDKDQVIFGASTMEPKRLVGSSWYRGSRRQLR